MDKLKREDVEDLIGKYKKLEKRISDAKKDGEIIEYNEWLDIRRIKSAKYTTINTNKKYLENLFVEFSDDERIMKAQVDRFEKCKSAYKYYVRIIDRYITENTPSAKKKESSQWYVYHFDNSNRLDKEPKLSRTILKIIDSKRVQFINTSPRKNYEGVYHKLVSKKSHYNTIFINFNSPYLGDKAPGIAHLRAYFTDIDSDEILMGAYITYEEYRIVQGSVVLERIKNDEAATPLLMSYKKSSKEFIEEVHWTIRRYLSLKHFNHVSVRNDITNTEELEEFIRSHPFPKWESRFFDEDIPTIFIAFPKLSHDVESSNEKNTLIQKLVTNLNDQLNPDKEKKKVKILKENTIIESFKRESITITLAPLQRTRMFILIYSKTSTASFSLIELGFAIAHAKTVMVFYEKGSISKRLAMVNRMNIDLIEFDDLETDLETLIYPTIIGKINSDLGSYLEQ